MPQANITQRLTFREMDSYALGYYDGRHHGKEIERPDNFTQEYYYSLGYEKGVADYCRFDIGELEDENV